MNLFFYINVLAGGGAERVVANLANSFSELGNQVSVVTSYKVENEYITDDDVERYVLEDSKDESGFVKRNLHRIHKLRNLLKENKPDLLISFMAEPNFRSIIATRFLKTKVIVSVRNDPKQEYPSKATRLLANYLYKMADGIVFQTDDARDFFNKKVRNRSTIIPNQVNSVFYSTPREEDQKDIVTAGRLTKQKNQKMLIEAFSEIKDLTDENLIIYGEGPERSELEKVVKEKDLCNRVFLPGNVSHIEKCLASAKLFVLSSDYEGMPNALLEAMAMGVPCISTDCPCGGPRMVIENGVNGILVPVRDKERMKKAIISLIKNDEMLENYSTLSKENARKYKPELIIHKWDNYFNEVVLRKDMQE